MRDDPANPDRGVAVLVYDGLSAFEFGVACDVFGPDHSTLVGVPWYELMVCAARAGPVRLSAGCTLHVPHGLTPLQRAGTIVLPPTSRPDLVPPETLAALRRAHARGARLVSLCTGALVLARTGLLSGRRAVTHWAHCGRLALEHPDVVVDAGALYVDEGDILTSAGSAAAIDLCVHLVRQDYGAEVAGRLAREMVVPPFREGGQAQYIATPLPEVQTSHLLADAMAWVREHLDEPVTVDDLARRSAMSRRTFARRFQATTGTSPYRWLLAQRIQLAQRLLETTDLPVDRVAARSGFVTAANLRKHFGTAIAVSPQSYRRSFKARATA
ncbi:MAG TPA: helix-turn-helix domain-containing protein [Acidimicrobiales bacterium]|nr:helix-turn-helix domain-containing protein [Acidimicrobiales bacterium]